MGSIKQLKNGKFKISVYDVNGKRHREVFEKHKYAKAYVDRIENEKSEAKLRAKNLIVTTIAVADAIIEIMETKKGLARKSIIKYERVFNQFNNFCENNQIRLINNFTREDADKFKKMMEETGLESRSINFYLQSIKALFEYQIERERMMKNPFSHIKYLKEKIKTQTEREEEYYHKDEIKSFFQQSIDKEYKDIITVLFLTGLRISELINLHWDYSIDLTDKIIKVRNYEGFQTKTIGSERDIPMTDKVYQIISAIKNKNGIIFKRTDGKKYNDKQILKSIKSAAEKAGITKNSTTHMWRHTFSTYLAEFGLREEERDTLMGHAKKSMAHHYTKINPQNLLPTIKNLESLM
ncbi:MAG: tyrosine-type recombinase/integrase [Melioribacteraceae bacterium]|nr:tyrosine-type recombinase/integrase [Melioribacteraceae bacterium]